MVNFIGMLGYSIIMPFLVFLVTRFGGNEFLYGIMGAVYPAFQFFGAPVLGRWSDRYGRRRILLLSQAGTLLAWVLFIVALALPITQMTQVSGEVTGTFTITLPLIVLFLARALDGLTGGNVSVANAYLSDVSDDSNRKANFGKMAMSSSLGFILGPAIAGVLGATYLKETLPVLAATAISMVAMYMIWFHLPETKTDLVKPDLRRFRIRKLFNVEHKECYELDDCPKKGLRAMLQLPNVPFLLLIYFLTFLGFSFFYAGFPLHASTKLQWDTLQLGLFFSVLSGMMIVVQGPVLSYLSGKFTDHALVIIGSLLLVGNFLLFSLASPVLSYVAAMLFALGNGLMWPSFLSILAKTAGKDQQGAVQGTANSAGSLASIIGLISGGFLYGQMGSYTFLLAAGILLVIFFLSFRFVKMARQASSSEATTANE